MNIELFHIFAYSGNNHSTDLFASACNVSKQHAEKLHNIYAKMDAVVETVIQSDSGSSYCARDVTTTKQFTF